MTTTAGSPRAAARAVAVVFAVSGFALSSWLARIPAVRDALEVSPGRLGLILLAVSLGSVLALPSSGPVVHRLRPARTVFLAATLTTSAMVGIGFGGGGAAGGVLLLVPALFLAGIGVGVWDVAMNVEGAAVEQEIGRDIMPWFHAAFSLGTVAGAMTGAAAAALDLSLAVHLAVVAAFSWLVVARTVRDFLRVPEPAPVDGYGPHGSQGPTGPAGAATERGGSGTLQAWRERRTLLIGLLALGMALAEGAANDWLALGLVDGYRLSHAGGAIGLGLFLTAMTVCRLAGPRLLRRLGRVTVLRGGALLVLVGVLGFVGAQRLAEPAATGPDALAVAVAITSTLVWGLGVALGFPVAMSAAADDPSRAPARVSVVASIGYVAFLAGPPLLGLLADHVGVVTAMLAVSVAVALGLLGSGSARALGGEPRP